MKIVHIGSSTFLGSVEHQILGLAQSLSEEFRSAFLSFREGGKCAAFLEAAREQGFPARALAHDTPHLLAAMSELTELLKECGADLVCTHGYKADILGLIASRRAGIPAVALSHGWTRESLRVRCYEALDRVAIRHMDRVVCVSHGQAAKARRGGVPAEKIVVIHCAVRATRFEMPDAAGAAELQDWFGEPSGPLIGAAGRLSPEKGFGDLADAAALALRNDPSLRFVLFGDGPLRGEIERRVDRLGLSGAFVLAGFRTDLDRFLPHLDLMVLPSYTEGLPNVVLESFAAGVPVVATAVGGTPEAVEDGVSGYLVPPGRPTELARRILDSVRDELRRREMGRRGRERVLREFSFESLARSFERLFREFGPAASPRDPVATSA
ncbi:MAG: glycosyltransferase, partial [Isosphaeraceae bacterium]